jgi:hypothetical protein
MSADNLFGTFPMNIKFGSAYDKANCGGGGRSVVSFVALRILIQFYGGFDIWIAPQVPEKIIFISQEAVRC